MLGVYASLFGTAFLQVATPIITLIPISLSWWQMGVLITDLPLKKEKKNKGN